MKTLIFRLAILATDICLGVIHGLILLGMLLTLSGCQSPKVLDLTPQPPLTRTQAQNLGTCVRVEQIADSRSMVPSIPSASLVILDFCYEFEDLRSGHVVVYDNGTREPNRPKYILHRLVRETPDGWIVKGDNNGWADAEKVTKGNFEALVVGFGRATE